MGRGCGKSGDVEAFSEDTCAFLPPVFLALAPSPPVWTPLSLAEPLLGHVPLRLGSAGQKGGARSCHLRLDGLVPWEPLASSFRPTHSTFALQTRGNLPHPSCCSYQGRPGGGDVPVPLTNSTHGRGEPVLPPQPRRASLLRCRVCRQTNLSLDSSPTFHSLSYIG